jgi:hypothetical protein
MNELSVILSSEQSPNAVLHSAAHDLSTYAPHSHIPTRRRNTIGPSLFCIPVSESDVSEHRATQKKMNETDAYVNPTALVKLKTSARATMGINLARR